MQIAAWGFRIWEPVAFCQRERAEGPERKKGLGKWDAMRLEMRMGQGNVARVLDG